MWGRRSDYEARRLEPSSESQHRRGASAPSVGSPSPCGEGIRVGVVARAQDVVSAPPPRAYSALSTKITKIRARARTAGEGRRLRARATTPTPVPSPQGGTRLQVPAG